MKIIALEEAFAIDELQDIPVFTKLPNIGPIDPENAKVWNEHDSDFTTYRLPDMNANGVSMHVLSLTAPGIQGISDTAKAIERAKNANDYLAKVVSEHPDRFAGFAALPMQDPDSAAEELRRCVEDLGFHGALVNDTTGGRYLDEAQYETVWKTLEDLDVPLYLHPGTPVDEWSLLAGCPPLGGAVWQWQAMTGGHAMRLLFAGVFDRYPGAKIILGHMGEFLPFQLTRFDSRYATFKDRSLEMRPSQYFGKNIFVTTSGFFSGPALAAAVAEMGEDAVLFSIDYPYESSKQSVEFLKSAPLSDAVREKVAWRNAARLLGLR